MNFDLEAVAARSGRDLRSTSPRPTFGRCLPATADSVGELRRGVSDFASRHGASVEARDVIALAVSEAVTNAVRHAYREAPRPGPVLVTATLDERTLLVTVSDEGAGMYAQVDDSGPRRGMALMARLADTLEISQRAAGVSGVVVRMRFGLAR